MVSRLGFSWLKIISISLNELHNVNKTLTGVKGLKEGLILQSAVSFPSY